MNAPDVKATANERLHHPFSPSTLQTRKASPCYHPRGGTSEAAEAGTRQHDATENEDHFNPLLSDAQSEAVAECVALLEEARLKMGVDATVEKEGYWPIDDERFRHGGREWVGTTAGYSDATIFSAVSEAPSLPHTRDIVATQHVHVVDWKFGKHSVEPAATNLQGKAYVLGVVHRQASRGIRVLTARVTFHCPHIEETTTHLFTEDDFAAMRAEVVAVVSVSRAADASWSEDPLIADTLGLVRPSTSSCLFCGRIGECPVVGRLAASVGSKFKPLLIPADLTGDKLCSDGQATTGLALGKVLEEWAKAYRKKITSRALEDDAFMPEGYGLVVTEPRKVVDNPGLFKKLVGKFGIDRVLSAFVDMPLTRVEDAISDEAASGLKDASVEAFKAELAAEGLTGKGSPVISLRMKGKKAA